VRSDPRATGGIRLDGSISLPPGGRRWWLVRRIYTEIFRSLDVLQCDGATEATNTGVASLQQSTPWDGNRRDDEVVRVMRGLHFHGRRASPDSRAASAPQRRRTTKCWRPLGERLNEPYAMAASRGSSSSVASVSRLPPCNPKSPRVVPDRSCVITSELRSPRFNQTDRSPRPAPRLGAPWHCGTGCHARSAGSGVWKAAAAGRGQCQRPPGRVARAPRVDTATRRETHGKGKIGRWTPLEGVFCSKPLNSDGFAEVH